MVDFKKQLGGKKSFAKLTDPLEIYETLDRASEIRDCRSLTGWFRPLAKPTNFLEKSILTRNIAGNIISEDEGIRVGHGHTGGRFSERQGRIPPGAGGGKSS
jgi:hypothetical protein